MAPHVYHRRVEKVEDFPDAVDGLAAGLKFVLFESISQAELETYRKPDLGWLRGRAFGEDKEIRWQQQGQSCDLHLLAERQVELEGWDELNLGLDEESEPTDILLWGVWNKEKDEDKKAWIETRIPRPLKYPIEGEPEHVKISALNYKRGGMTVLTRLRKVEPYDA